MAPTRGEELAVIRAVIYASLFDYPLTLAQLRETLGVATDEVTLARWLEAGPLLRHVLRTENGFIFPYHRSELVERRLAREAASRERLRLDAAIVRTIAALPFVRMVAISGSLAHLNGEEGADLDLFVITAPSRVWSVTLVALLLAKAMGWRNRLCLNYVISEAALPVGPEDLFTANQIIHLQPVTGAPTYQAFLDANPFVRMQYPNFRPRPLPETGAPRPARLAAAVQWVLRPAAPLLEHAARGLYRWHLHRRAAMWHSPGQVRLEAECLKLHTCSHRDSVMARFEAELAAVIGAAAGPEPLHVEQMTGVM
jgi:hypothetical protein